MTRILSILIVILLNQWAWGVEISPMLQSELESKDKIDAILYLKDKADLTPAYSILDRQSRVTFVHNLLITVADRSQKEIKNYLEEKNLRFIRFYTQNAMAVFGLSKELFEQLKNFDEISYIGPNAKSGLNLPEPLEPFEDEDGIPFHLKTVKVDKAWEEFKVKGEGIIVAGQDTGYLWQHESIRKKYRGYSMGKVDHNYNWLDAIAITQGNGCSAGGAVPCDDHNHGTHTIGTMVGDDEKGNRIGVAPEAKWFGCRNMVGGVGTVASYLTCFDFIMAPYPLAGDPMKDGKPELAPHIINNSWSCPKKEGCRGDEFAGVIAAYKAAGILMVVAAGNDGPGCGTASKQPGIYAGDVITVGSWNHYMSEIAFFSGRGPSPLFGQLSPNLIAPGGVVKSASSESASEYVTKTGTSMSAPQVAGAAALLWSYRPELIGQTDLTLEILQKSADPYKAKQDCGSFPGSQTPNAVYGYGMLNVHRALEMVK